MDDAWPRSSSEAVEGWKQKYATFSRALEEKASACGLDSAHLSRVLETIVANEPDRGVVVLPVAAYQVTLNGELVWFVCRRWGVGREKVITLEHVEVSAFNKRLERVAYKTCG